MTVDQEARQDLDNAIDRVENALAYFDDDEAFVLFERFSINLRKRFAALKKQADADRRREQAERLVDNLVKKRTR